MANPSGLHKALSFTSTSRPRRLDGWTVERRRLRRRVRPAVGVVAVALLAVVLMVLFA